ncbi:hypothetical protein NAT47_00355 [Flavobacterium sp. HXWNR69]|uniref:Uncharacterized protein n=1 Tax=Flavobacterium fragile TaxID=2949085 RepID=A0ABT0TD18_9FLAO|nr:hypothetical protein [Flavobacterium sp. HXWNR69]MCL9768862.1 hypothetical protein [Flavobacterium sp. HXWNR69]
MVLKQQSVRFELRILDYQFLVSNFIDDLNWLNIEILAEDNFYSWKAKGAFLRTDELVELLNWFEQLYLNHETINEKLFFLENEISFEYYKELRQISVNLDFNFHPKKEKYVYGQDYEYKLFFELNKLNLEKILLSLRTLILKFPNKDEKGDS